MRRTIDHYVQAIDLQMDEVYEVDPTRAEQFVAMGIAEFETKRPKLEAAALAPAERRG
jgi:hypothetical protein